LIAAAFLVMHVLEVFFPVIVLGGAKVGSFAQWEDCSPPLHLQAQSQEKKLRAQASLEMQQLSIDKVIRNKSWNGQCGLPSIQFDIPVVHVIK